MLCKNRHQDLKDHSRQAKAKILFGVCHFFSLINLFLFPFGFSSEGMDPKGPFTMTDCDCDNDIDIKWILSKFNVPSTLSERKHQGNVSLSQWLSRKDVLRLIHIERKWKQKFPLMFAFSLWSLSPPLSLMWTIPYPPVVPIRCETRKRTWVYIRASVPLEPPSAPPRWCSSSLGRCRTWFGRCAWSTRRRNQGYWHGWTAAVSSFGLPYHLLNWYTSGS